MPSITFPINNAEVDSIGVDVYQCINLSESMTKSGELIGSDQIVPASCHRNTSSVVENKNTLSSIEERDELYALKQPSCVPAVGVDNFPSVDCIKNCVANVNGADHAKQTSACVCVHDLCL